MSLNTNLDAARAELDRLGLRTEAYLRDDEGHPGVVVVYRDGRTRTFTGEGWDLQDEAQTLEWACIVASLAREVTA